MNTGTLVKFVQISASSFNNLSTKDSGTIYFVQDTVGGDHYIYLDGNRYTPLPGGVAQMPGGTGIYAPPNIVPAAVGNGSILVTEGSGVSLGNKSLAVSTGYNINCRSAAAGSAVYRVTNTYENRLKCSGFLVNGAVLALNESSAMEGKFANVISVQINGASYTPDSSANDTTQANDIVITVDATINPDAATTSIRIYPAELGFSTLFVGQGVGSNGGASVIVGQSVMNFSGNANCLVGASMYNQGNGNGVFGRLHISRKNRWLLAGTGHDNTNGRAESGVAFGEYSDIKATTLFAIGNGTGQTNRNNIFEIGDDGGIIIPSSTPDSTKKFKLTVDDTGTITATEVV